MARNKILLIDDMSTIRKLMKRLLETNTKYKVVEASDGVQGFQLMQTFHEELFFVISDLHMPKASGEDFLNRTINTAGPDKVPVFIVSEETNQDVIDRLLKKGAADFIIKPFTSEKLASVLKKTDEIWKAS